MCARAVRDMEQSASTVLRPRLTDETDAAVPRSEIHSEGAVARPPFLPDP